MCGGGDSKNIKSGLYAPIARPIPVSKNGRRSGVGHSFHKWLPSVQGCPRLFLRPPQSNSERQTEKQLSPKWAWLVQVSALNTQDGNDLRPRSHSQILPPSPCSSEGVVQKLIQDASWDKRLLSQLLWDFRVAYLEGASFSSLPKKRYGEIYSSPSTPKID